MGRMESDPCAPSKCRVASNRIRHISPVYERQNAQQIASRLVYSEDSGRSNSGTNSGDTILKSCFLGRYRCRRRDRAGSECRSTLDDTSDPRHPGPFPRRRKESRMQLRPPFPPFLPKTASRCRGIVSSRRWLAHNGTVGGLGGRGRPLRGRRGARPGGVPDRPRRLC